MRARIGPRDRASRSPASAPRCGPGLSENELWSVLHQGVIALGGDYVETPPALLRTPDEPLVPGDRRPTPSGRTSSSRSTPTSSAATATTATSRAPSTPGPDDADARAEASSTGTPTSRCTTTWSSCAPARRSASTRQQAWKIPERYVANRYFVSAHGCGMTGEYPYLYHSMDFEEAGYDGVIEPGMTLCVESYIGEEGGDEGVKLEQQLLVTEDGPELLSTFPFEAALLDRPA